MLSIVHIPKDQEGMSLVSKTKIVTEISIKNICDRDGNNIISNIGI